MKNSPYWLEFKRPGIYIEEIAVYAEYIPGFSGTRETPAESSHYSIINVKWRDVDITSALTLDDMQYIQDKLKAEE